MDAFVTHSRSIPIALFTSQDIRDRASLFTASIYSVDSPSSYKSLMNHLKSANKSSANPASHVISALRCMALKPKHTGLNGPDDFVLQTENDDDDEKWGSQRILSVMQAEGIIDAVVVVKRWYGGIMLGPARFTHVETCTREVCRLFKKKEELDGCIASILNLDGILEGLRDELAQFTGTKSTTKKQGYDEWTVEDLPKARQIVVAREKAISSLKAVIDKRKQEQQYVISVSD